VPQTSGAVNTEFLLPYRLFDRVDDIIDIVQLTLGTAVDGHGLVPIRLNKIPRANRYADDYDPIQKRHEAVQTHRALKTTQDVVVLFGQSDTPPQEFMFFW
jgi:hypothetical protein